MHKGEIEKCVCKIKNNKTGGSDGLGGELLKYGGIGMVDLLHQLLKVVWHEETVPKQCRECVICLRSGIRKILVRFRGITLLRLSVVGKVLITG